jgi:predicted GTPase
LGKTATMRYVALKMKDEGYTVVPTNSPEDIRNFSKKGKKMLFVVDDVCGNYTSFSQSEANKSSSSPM